jgi:hypothetical protein
MRHNNKNTLDKQEHSNKQEQKWDWEIEGVRCAMETGICPL